MPTYDYKCDKCRKTYELRQGFDAASEHACELCGKGVAKRVLSAPTVVFKGSGFYVTDSRSKSTAAVDNSKDSDSGTAKKSESKKSDSKKSSDSSSTKTESSSTPAPAASSE